MTRSLPVRLAEPEPNWITATWALPPDGVRADGPSGCCDTGAVGEAIAAIWAVARSAEDAVGGAAGTAASTGAGGGAAALGGVQPGGGTNALLGSADRVGAASGVGGAATFDIWA